MLELRERDLGTSRPAESHRPHCTCRLQVTYFTYMYGCLPPNRGNCIKHRKQQKLNTSCHLRPRARVIQLAKSIPSDLICLSKAVNSERSSPSTFLILSACVALWSSSKTSAGLVLSDPNMSPPE